MESSHLPTLKRSLMVLEQFAEEPMRKRLRSSSKSGSAITATRVVAVRSSSFRRVQFAPQLAEYRVIPPFDEQDRQTAFYSDEDYMRFFVREKSRVAVINLTTRICREQERRLRNRIQAIPSSFIAINFLHAMLTIEAMECNVEKNKNDKQQGDKEESSTSTSPSVGSSNNTSAQSNDSNNAAASKKVVQKLPDRHSVGAACA